MSWYDFGHKYEGLYAYLPDGKEIIDTGFYYHELMALGNWYFQPIPGSGQRSFYNRVYINIDKDDCQRYGIDRRSSAFINLAKSRFGKFEVKFNEWDVPEDIQKRTIDNWVRYFTEISERVVKSYIVLYPDGRNDKATMFDSYKDAFAFAQVKAKGLSTYLLEKYGVMVYKPHSEKPLAEFWRVVE